MKNLANKRSRSKSHRSKSDPLEIRFESRKSNIRKENIIEAKKDFLEIDIDDSGYIDIKELHKGLNKYGIKLTLNKTKNLLKNYDDNPDGKIEMKEFMQLKNDIDIGKFRKHTKRTIKKHKKHTIKKHRKRTKHKKHKTRKLK